MGGIRTAREIGLRPLTARSVVLSLLLGAHPPQLPVRDLVRAGQMFDISEPALRVALTRMVSAGDLHRTGSTSSTARTPEGAFTDKGSAQGARVRDRELEPGQRLYRLSDRLVQRQHRQDDAVHPETTDWQGEWETAIITATGRSASDRSALRTRLTGLRLGELREGVWLRPANLRRPWPGDLDGIVTGFSARPAGDPVGLARALWNLDDWAGLATALLEHFDAADQPADRFTIAAAVVRHLLADPVLPDELLPQPWPANSLRRAYQEYQVELIEVAELPEKI